MTNPPRMTRNVVALLAIMSDGASKAWYGLELAREAGIGSATVYAALTRLERAQLVDGTWEAIDPSVAGRPARRLYQLTGQGSRIADGLAAQRRAAAIERSRGAAASWRPHLGGHPA